MRPSPARPPAEPRGPRRDPAPPVPPGEGPSVWAKFPYLCLVGFVATQGFLIPVVALPINWAMWPAPPDLFGYALFASVLLSPSRRRVSPLDRENLRDLILMLALFTTNFLFVTIPFSQTGVGVKFGGFTLLLLAKYILVFWAASHIPMTRARLKTLHRAAYLAFLWVVVTMMADRFHVIEIDRFTWHLPSGSAGKWSTIDLNSTVGPNHGQTSMAILILAAFVVTTAGPLLGWVTEAIVLLIGGAGTFLTGSRQGIVRLATFVVVYLLPQPKRLFLIAFAMVFLALFIGFQVDTGNVIQNEAAQASMDRQMVLFQDPLSNEGLSGRPELWMSVLYTLNERPIRWVVGYGIGNYAEYKNAAHSMILQLLQDGGCIMLVAASWLWGRIFVRIWRRRKVSWHMVALTAGLLASSLTSGIFYPNLATGWYLGLYFVLMHVAYCEVMPERSGRAQA